MTSTEKSSNRKKWDYEWGVTGKPVAWISRNRKHKKKKKMTKNYEENYCKKCRKLQDVKENLAKKNVQPHQYSPSSSHELPMEPRVKVVSGKHSIYTLFPKNQNCDICLRTKITSSSCRRRTGTVVPRAEHIGDLMTADHKSSQWKMWISKQSSIRRCGTRLGNSVVTNHTQKSLPHGNLTRGQIEIQNPTQRRVLKEGWKMHTLTGWWLK